MLKNVVRTAAWSFILFGEFALGYYTGYWGISAALWYVSGLTTIWLVDRHWEVPDSMSRLKELIGLFAAFALGTFGLAMLNTAGHLPLRPPKASPATD